MPRFLVVDDDPSTVKAMTQLLTDDGHVVTPFTAGADAVKALSRDAFDVVVTDLEMPDTNGHAVVQAARAHAPNACIIVTSTRGRENEATLAGACMVADKPIDYDAITQAVGACRTRGGPPTNGRCHLRSPVNQAPTRLRRR